MKNLIMIEWLKLSRLITMRVVLIIYILLVPSIYLLLSQVNLMGWTFPDYIWKFPESYHFAAYISSWFNLLIGMIIIVFATNELKYKTQRQNMIDGLSKREIILSKFYVVLLFTCAITIYTFLVGFMFGAINGDISDMFEGIDQIGMYFIATLGYFAFAYLFANLIRLPALAIVLYLTSTFVEGIVGFFAAQEYVQLFPLTTFAGLVPIPILPQGAGMEMILDQGVRAVLSLVYVGVFIFIAYWVIKRRDI